MDLEPTRREHLIRILEVLVSRERLAYAVAFEKDGVILAEAGSPAGLKFGDLVTTLIGEPQQRINTYAHLEGRILPQMWAQGGDEAILDKITDDIAVVYFAPPEATPPGDAVALYRWAKAFALGARAEFTEP